jgi:hypothetical protein
MRDPIVQKRLDEYYLRCEQNWQQKIESIDVYPMLKRLPELDKLTEDACEAARGKVDDSVNWGDLGCVEASIVVPLEGEPYYQVIIEEASPDACDFRLFISNYLEYRGFPNATVVTEW